MGYILGRLSDAGVPLTGRCSQQASMRVNRYEHRLVQLPDADSCENLLVHTSFAVSPIIPESPPELPKRHLRASTTVSMACEFQLLLSSGEVRNQANIAHLFNLSRARVTQIMAILRLPSPVVDYLASLSYEEQARYNERELRKIRSLPTEEEQITAFEELRTAVDASKRPIK